MKVWRSTLVADGSSDRALIPLISRTLQIVAPELEFAEIAVADMTTGSLRERINLSLQDYPCDILFVHRDAESQEPERRLQEIFDATTGLSIHSIAVVPVKMTESWLITDSHAIRTAVGNSTGTEPLELPAIKNIERVDAKKVLDAALTAAAFKGARRRQKFRPEKFRYRVADNLANFDLLRQLPSFAAFERRLILVLEKAIPRVTGR